MLNAEQALAANGGVLPSFLKVIAGWDGAAVRPLSVNAAGVLNVAASLSSVSDPAADGQSNTQFTLADTSANVLTLQVYSYLFNGTTWDRTRSGATTGSTLVNNNVAGNLLCTATLATSSTALADGASNTEALIGLAQNFAMLFNGTTWDRQRSGTAPGSMLVNNSVAANLLCTATLGTSSTAFADGASNTEAIIGLAQNFGMLFNGTTWDRARSGTATGSMLVNNSVAANLLCTATLGTSSTAFADGASNTEAIIGLAQHFGMVFNGTTWDRQRGTTSGTQVIGPLGSGSAVAGQQPVLIGTRDTSGNVAFPGGDTRGIPFTSTAVTNADGFTNSPSVPCTLGNGTIFQVMGPFLFNGSTWDRARTAGIGNNVAATGIAAAAKYGQYLTIANQPALTTGNYAAVQLDSAANQKVVLGAPAIGNILAGTLSHTATTAAATIVTVPAGKTFRGKITISVTLSKAAAAANNGQAIGVISYANGTGVATPAAGNYFAVAAYAGANAATGTVGTQGANSQTIDVIVNASAAGTALIQGATTINNATDARVDYTVSGEVQ